MRHTPRRTLAVTLALGIIWAPGVASAQSPSPAASAAPGAGAELRLPAAPGVLPPGRYRTDALGPVVMFELGEGWQGTQAPGLFELFWREAPGYVGASVFTGVVYPDPCDPNTRDEVEPTIDAFTTWLTNQVALEATATTTTFAGLPATRYDARVAFMACPQVGHLSLWGDFGLYPTEALRLFVVDNDDQVIIVTAESEHATDFDAFLETAQPVLDSMAIAGPELPPDVARIAT